MYAAMAGSMPAETGIADTGPVRASEQGNSEEYRDSGPPRTSASLSPLIAGDARKRYAGRSGAPAYPRERNRMMTEKRNLTELFSTVHEYFTPKIVGEVNDVYVKIAKVKGRDVPWHAHDGEDELFLVLSGTLTIQVRGRDDVILAGGDFFIVEKGTEHRVYSDEECRLMLIENKTTKHTGGIRSAITRSIDEQHY